MKTIQVKNPITEAQEQHEHPKREWLLFGHVFFLLFFNCKTRLHIQNKSKDSICTNTKCQISILHNFA